MAYAFGGLDGCTFVLATPSSDRFLSEEESCILFSAGILGALAILSKRNWAEPPSELA